MLKKYSAWIAIGLLAATSLLAWFSLRGDSAIYDESVHLPAGYSYVTRGDMRLNPEHPPLTKDVAGIALVAWSKLTRSPISFPSGLPSWTSETNGEWTFGPQFLYRANHDSQAMLMAGRLPTLLLFFGFGLFLFFWIKRRWGSAAALLAIFFYALSPTVLAHARFVTTDLPAAAAFFASATAFLKWIERPTWKNLAVFALVFGLAQLVKFSLIILIPLFPALILVKTVFEPGLASLKLRALVLLKRLSLYALALVAAFGLVVTPVYVLHTINYPIAKQRQDLNVRRPDYSNSSLSPFVFWSADKPILRSFGHYLTGIMLVQNRSHFGSTTFFRGIVDNAGRMSYFPTVYLIKEPLAFHLLTAVALAGFAAALVRRRRNLRQAPAWIDRHLAEISFISIIAFYWWTSIHSQLNIGVRHVLPTFPFIYILISRQLAMLGQKLKRSLPRFAKPGLVLLSVLLLWQAVSVVKVHPSYLAYFNELAGGPDGGANFVADSNLDWGQDLNRLAEYAKRQNIQLLWLDYFGSADPQTVMPNVAHQYHVEYGSVKGWLAISQTFLTNERGRGGPHVTKGPNRYAWLNAYTPAANIGHSIVVYYIPE